MNPLGIAIIASGGIALANHLPGLALTGKTRIVALCDSDPATLERCKQAAPVAKTFSDYRDVMKLGDVDAVVVATPNSTHREIALAAVAAGKHVMCEKPLALDLAGAREMLDEARRASVRHMTAFT